ncbi:hypothetical protein [Agrobacterium pusense]|uniref:hypothetical protein n=1 Tax=Agrobacterium pusense TaxID=648995 RepID=UPI001C6EA9FC|nr:hypothetical protein [Agrobacterium pusense]MBW9060890.1 hypothetical protein [Agrobacterium pusense]
MSGFTEEENTAEVQKRVNGVAKCEDGERVATRWYGLKASKARGLSGDFTEEGREQPTSQDRSDLDAMFR